MMDGLPSPTRVPLRSPEQVMRLSRMGNFHPMRLSFMRILLRRIKAEGWHVTRSVWDIDDAGVGRAVYTATGPDRSYSLVAFAHDLPDHLRSDRVIAEAWDATFALYDGVPTRADLDRLQRHVPVQEAGRLSIHELTLSRANRSVRLFRHVIDALASGEQPDAQELAKVGYLMRTTAVYGSGKFGLADRDGYCDRPELNAPFQAEMLTVWLIRTFSIDIVEHLARVQGGDTAVPMAPDLRRSLGIGNSTGLGMAPFLLTHPVLIHHWIAAKEQAFARVRALPEFTARQWRDFRTALEAASANVAGWVSEHPIQIEKLAVLKTDMNLLRGHVAALDETMAMPAEALWHWAEAALGEDAQELLVSLLIEPFGDLVDELAEKMSADEHLALTATQTTSVADLKTQIDHAYGWATDTDWAQAEATARLWYVSAEKLEPRLAERADEPLEPYEQSLAPARDIAALRVALATCDPSESVAAFLSRHPEHRDAVRRVELVRTYPFAEIQDNTVAADMLPIDMLRAKLSFFGATRFDPRSDRWVRITMFNGAPFPDEIHDMDGDAWMYGVENVSAGATQRRTQAGEPISRPCQTCALGKGCSCWSHGEIAALSAKAARGAGLPWGVASEAARAVRLLSEQGLPGAEALAADLRRDVPGATLLAGCAIADANDLTSFERRAGHILLRKWDNSHFWDDCFINVFNALLNRNMDKNLKKGTRDTNKDTSCKFYYCDGLLSSYQREIWRLSSQKKPFEMFVCNPRFHVRGCQLRSEYKLRMRIANREETYCKCIRWSLGVHA